MKNTPPQKNIKKIGQESLDSLIKENEEYASKVENEILDYYLLGGIMNYHKSAALIRKDPLTPTINPKYMSFNNGIYNELTTKHIGLFASISKAFHYLYDLLQTESETDLSIQFSQSDLNQVQEDYLRNKLSVLRDIKAQEVKGPPLIPSMPKGNYETMQDIFQEDYKEQYKEFLNVLGEVTPPLINNGNEWIGNKGAARLFIKELETQCVIHPIKNNITREGIYNVFDPYFSNLGKSFMRNQESYKSKAEYSNEFETHIRAIKSKIDSK